MRAVMTWNRTPVSCGTFSYGEVEDYTVVISATSVSSFAGLGSSSRVTGEAINRDMFELSLRTYPNPVINELMFNFNEFKEVKSVKIINANGVEMTSYSTNLEQNKVEISELASGIYILSLNTERGRFEVRFVKE